MAVTYDYLPYDISDIFRSIVGEVNDHVTTDSSLDIPRVSFKDETYKELIKRLKADGESNTKKGSRYPLIALIHRYEQEIASNSPYIQSSFDFVIVTQSDKSMLSEERRSKNYRPILYPIYMEFLEMIANSRFFQGPYNPYPEHKVYESFNFGKDGTDGNSAYIFPDSVDALVITGMKLKINRPRVAAFTYGPAKTLSYINNVGTLRCVINGASISVWLDQANYNDSSFVGHPEYRVYFSHAGLEEGSVITIGGNVTTVIEATDGDYYGYIACADGLTTSRLAFYYSIYKGVINKVTSYNKFRVQNFVLSGFDYPDYPFDVETQTTANKSIISRRELNSGGGNVLLEEFITPSSTSAGNNTYTEYAQSSSSYSDIGCTINIDCAGSNPNILLESISFFKIT